MKLTVAMLFYNTTCYEGSKSDNSKESEGATRHPKMSPMQI